MPLFPSLLILKYIPHHNEKRYNVSQIGLGLAFCKMAVEAQGGTLVIAPNQPQGSIFTVEI